MPHGIGGAARASLAAVGVVVLAGLIVAGTRFAGPAPAAMPDPNKGAALSVACAGCHGSNGLSVDTNIPNLAGQHYAYLIRQMHAFRQGTRKNATMNHKMATLSEEQMRHIAAYYANVPFQAGRSGRGRR
ncbi:MAG: cytochrome c [Alphaproteobacteria bacterium]|nr:cytochrome c [Alphaproteobacteria bacterium]